MSLFRANEKCSLCNTSLSPWNVNTCTRCGHKMCSRHTLLLRNPHSYVLSSVCVCCSDQQAVLPRVEFSLPRAEHVVRT